MICTFCGMQFEGETCPICGTKAEYCDKGIPKHINPEDLSHESKQEYTQSNNSSNATKICGHCGQQVPSNAAFCGHCGYSFGAQAAAQPASSQPAKSKGFGDAIKILMIVGTVSMALATYGLGLIWCLPMYTHYNEKMKRGEKLSTSFKICTMLFDNTIAGVLMLLEN